MIIGITGQTATGKSTLSNIFKKNGYLIFDADKAYNLLFTENHNMQQEILKEFNTLDKKNILKTVMHNPELLEKLNLITHKYVIHQINAFINDNKNRNIVLDVPVPVEKGFINTADIIIVTVASKEIQIARLTKRYSINKDQAVDRINMQMKWENYLEISDIILNTTDTDENDLISFIKIFENTYIKGNKD